MTSFAAARRAMVDNQLRTFDVSDRAVLAAMAEVPREEFVPASQKALAYLDRNLVLGEDASDPRVMLAPMVLARLLQALDIRSGDRSLDVGGGFGYTAAVLAAMGARAVLLESRADLAAEATRRVGPGVSVASGPLEDGAGADGPFDKIVVNGAVQTRPEALLDQLGENGRLACLTREGGNARAVLYLRSSAGVGQRTLFDATAPVLAGFALAEAFSF